LSARQFVNFCKAAFYRSWETQTLRADVNFGSQDQS